MQVLGLLEVFQPVEPEVTNDGVAGHRVGDEGSRRIGEHDLAAVPGRGDACGPVHLDAQVVVTPEDALAGVQPHAYPDDPVFGPPMGRELALHGHGRLQRA